MPAAHEPTDDTRRTVSVLAGVGTKHSVIASSIGVSVNTLKAHYRQELTDGREIANAKVVDTLFRMATSGRVPAATFFWAKTQMGWRETERVEHVGANGEPIKAETTIRVVYAEEPLDDSRSDANPNAPEVA